MKTICMVSLLSFHFALFGQEVVEDNQYYHHAFYRTIHYCPLTDSTDIINSNSLIQKFGKPPSWPDSAKCKDAQNREKAVQEAFSFVWKLLARCGRDTRVYTNSTDFDKFVNKDNPDQVKKYFEELFQNPDNFQLRGPDEVEIFQPELTVHKPSIRYSRVQTRLDLYAFIDKQLQQIYAKPHKDIQYWVRYANGEMQRIRHCPGYESVGKESFERRTESTRLKNASTLQSIDHNSNLKNEEEFAADIIIYPLLFDRQYLFMEGEVEKGNSPWAKNLLQALIYVILHEMAHYEFEVIKKSDIFNYPDRQTFNDSEKACGRWATSILHAR